MKKLLFLFSATTALLLTSCGNDDGGPAIIEPTGTCNDGVLNNGETEIDCGGANCQPCVEEPEEESTCDDGIMNGDETEVDFGGACSEIITVTGEIAEDTTWERRNIYILSGKVVVGVGVTLTIEPGTIIKGETGTGSLASALVVQRGSTINAVGTAERPIVFTSEQDDIAVGQTAGTNLDENDNGLWGGLLVLGSAPASLSGDVTEEQIEGIPASEAYGLYGGDNAADGSGDLAYISIRHGGALIGEGNEINGLTLGGVGTGTSVDHIEIVGNEDDGIEIFGGTVDVSNVFVWAGGDDGIDLDQAWTGTLNNGMVVQGIRSDSAMELDGPEGSADGAYTLNNITLVGNTDDGEGAGARRVADLRDGLQANINNVYVTGFLPSTVVRLNGDDSSAAYNDGLMTFSNWEIVLPASVAAVNDLFTLEEVTVATTFSADASGFATAVIAGEESVGADTSVFAWTYANAKASLGF